MQIRQVGGELLHVTGGTEGRRDRQNDTKKIIVAFCILANCA
jgi:hypothetical protein